MFFALFSLFSRFFMVFHNSTFLRNSHPLAPDCCWSESEIKQIPKAEAFESHFIWLSDHQRLVLVSELVVLLVGGINHGDEIPKTPKILKNHFSRNYFSPPSSTPVSIKTIETQNRPFLPRFEVAKRSQGPNGPERSLKYQKVQKGLKRFRK